MQLLAPLVIAFVLAGYLKDSESASTWTLAAQKLQSSLWPTLLRLDSSYKSGVRSVIRVLATAMPVFALLAAIAGIVTPLGLGEELRPSGETSASFEYVPDTSAFLAGTTPRGKEGFSRLCSVGRGLLASPSACPYTGDQINRESDDDGISVEWDNISTDIPDIIQEIFSSGTASEKTTVSNFFDIEWRQYTSTVRDNVNNNNTYGIGIYRQLESFILENKYVLVEGLIIDAKVGGIGFRNHTIPSGMPRGAEWEEDILFIEPDTACVNTNLTIDFTVKYNMSDQSTGVSDLRLVDRGGFVNLNTTYPEYDMENPQKNPDLYGRAFRGAYLNNAYTMLMYNITNDNTGSADGKGFDYIDSEIGKDFPLTALPGDGYQALGMSEEFANYLHFNYANSSLFDIPDYPNPFNVTEEDIAGISLSCAGSGYDDESTLSNIYVACGLLRGAPNRKDEGPRSLLEHESEWSSPLHSCASALRATVKTVSFSYNSTDSQGFDNLAVTGIRDKEYESESDMPLWGFEVSGYNIGNIRATWGLISPEYESRENVSSIRAPHLLLSGLYSSSPPTLGQGLSENYAASEFPSRVMNTVFQLEEGWPFDLLGLANMAIFTRWQNLSSSAETSADIIKLLWTDLAASGVVGTKGVLGPLNDEEAGATSDIKVRPIDHRITYNYLYGIPAFVLGVSIILLLVTMMISMCFGRGSMHKLRLRFQQLSAGRIFASFLYADTSNLTMRSAEWARANGNKDVTLGTFAERSMKPMHPVAGGSLLADTKRL